MALKEWAVLVDAMARGDIIGMVRKGGIREQRAGFSVRAPRFLLYPTYFHENPSDIAPRFLPQLGASLASQPPAGRVRIEYVATGVTSVHLTDLEQLPPLQHEVGISWTAITSRFNYRQPGVHFIAARVARLREPVDIAEMPRYSGCVSWLRLDDRIACDDAEPIMSDADFAQRLEDALRGAAK